jgi:hypothetical protein
MWIRREVIDRLIADSGLVRRDQTKWTRVDASDGSARRIYIRRTEKVTSVHLAGFIPPFHPGITMLTDNESQKISRSVKAVIDFSKAEGTIVGALQFR